MTQIEPPNHLEEGVSMEHQLQKQLTDIAKQLSETHVTMTQMSSKIDHLETIMNMKVDSNKSELEHQIRDLSREVTELKKYKDKHTDDHQVDARDKTKMVWGIVMLGITAIVNVILEVASR